MPEDKIDMCKAIEMRINSERADAAEKAAENTLLQNIRSLMETVKFSAEQAMNALKVPISDQPRLAGLL